MKENIRGGGNPAHAVQKLSVKGGADGVTRFKYPTVAILTIIMHSGIRLWFCKTRPKAACDKIILAHFLCSQWEVGTREYRPITEKWILRRVSISIFKISQEFQRRKLIIVKGREKIVKDFENHQSIHRTHWLKCLELQQIYPFRDSVPLKTPKALKTYSYVVKRHDTFILADFLSWPYTAFYRGGHGENRPMVWQRRQ